MKAKKLILGLVVAFAAIFGLAAQVNVETVDYVPDSSNVKILGRTIQDKNNLWMCLSSSGVAFNIEAKRLDVTITGDSGAVMRQDNGNSARVVVLVNGERKLDTQVLKKEQSFTIFDGEALVTGEVQILKVSEAQNSVAAIKKISLDKDGKISPAAEKDLKIEFIGDSITCGYGVDDQNRNNHFKTATEDNTKTYAYKTAVNLNADYSMFSFSGWGIVSSYSGDGTKQTYGLVPAVYEKTGSCGNRAGNYTVQNVSWDFSKFVPDFVVINLGTNDASYTKGDNKKIEEYKTAYKKFLKTVRKDNPDAKIICCLGMMGQDLCPAIEALVQEYRDETGDEKVYSLKLDNQNQADGICADWHPSKKTHTKAAAKLTAKIKELLAE